MRLSTMNDHALIKLDRTNDGRYTFVTIKARTFRWRILLFSDGLREFASHTVNYHIERDLDKLIELTSDYSTVNFKVTHIGTGRETVYNIDWSKFHRLVDGEIERAIMYREPERRYTVRLHGNAPTDPKRRRALSKAIRDHFMQYIGHNIIVIYNDGKLDYYFRELDRTDGEKLMDGGLIYDTYSDRNVYSMHT